MWKHCNLGRGTLALALLALLIVGGLASATFYDFSICQDTTMYGGFTSTVTGTHWLRAKLSGLGTMKAWVTDNTGQTTYIGPITARDGGCLTTTGSLTQGVSYRLYGQREHGNGNCGYAGISSTEFGPCSGAGPGGE
jgi:hypothetical protein